MPRARFAALVLVVACGKTAEEPSDAGDQRVPREAVPPSDSECELAGDYCGSPERPKVGKFESPICTDFPGVVRSPLSCRDSQGNDSDFICCHRQSTDASVPDGG